MQQGDLLEREVGQQDPAAHPKRFLRLDRVDELDVGSQPDHEVAGLPDVFGQPDQMRPGDAQQRGRGTGAAAQVGEGAAGPVGAIRRLLDETAEPEHRDEAMRRRPRDAELGRRIAHPEHTVALQHQQQLERVVDGLDRVGRDAVLHDRTITAHGSGGQACGLM